MTTECDDGAAGCPVLLKAGLVHVITATAVQWQSGDHWRGISDWEAIILYHRIWWL